MENTQLEKINKFINLIDSCINDIKIQDESIFIEFKKDLILYTKGHTLLCGDGQTIIKSKCIHLNPERQYKKDKTPNEFVELITHDNKIILKDIQSKLNEGVI